MQLFYDIEVFKYDSLLIITDHELNIVHQSWVSEPDPLISQNSKAHQKARSVVRDNWLIGYNNYFYDDFILTGMLGGYTQKSLKELNDQIINKKKPSLKVTSLIKSLDAFQQISVSKIGLKTIQANMGLDIHESSVSFNIDRPLTQEEKEETVSYCLNDIRTTIQVFKMRSQYFETKEYLVKMLPPEIQDRAVRWNTTSISALIVNPKQDLPQWDTLRFGGYEDYFSEIPHYHDLIRIFKQEIKKFRSDEFDNKIEWGIGGLHSVIGKGVWEDLLHIDVASMYPNIVRIINGLEHNTKIYNQIVEDRLQAKREGDKQKAEALKLVVNSVYGLLKNKYSSLYNPPCSSSVTIFGQLALFTLGELLSPYAEIIQLNTDGAVVKIKKGFDESDIDFAIKQWEQDFDMILEKTHFKKFIQRDVNNYIAITDKGIKAKGGDVKRFDKSFLFDNNSLRIVDLCLVNYMVHGIPILDTIIQNIEDKELFMIVLKVGSTFKGIVDEEGNELQKVNRAFATKEGSRVFKQRPDNTLVNFPKMPPKVTIHNSDISLFDSSLLDLDYYNELCESKLRAWKYQLSID